MTDDAVPVSLSLLTDDEVFSTSFDGDVRRWRTKDRALRRLIEGAEIGRAGEADSSRLRRDVAFLVEGQDRLLLPLGAWAAESTEARSVDIEPDDSDEDYWGDWLRVEDHLEGILQTCHRGSTELILTCEPPDGFAAKCQIGSTRSGLNAIFVMQNERSDEGPWANATRAGDWWVLQSPISASAVGAAGRLLMIAMRGQGAGPTDVFPSYVTREFMGEG